MIISRRRRKKKGLKRWNMDNLMEYDVKDNTLDHSLISFSWKPKKGRASLLLNQLPLSLARCISTTTVCTREFTYISSTSTFHLSLSLYFFPPLLYNGDECGGHAPSSSAILSRSYPFQFRDPSASGCWWLGIIQYAGSLLSLSWCFSIFILFCVCLLDFYDVITTRDWPSPNVERNYGSV
jgi:hypothetical protein